jgi:hypothetical protein
MPSITIWNRIEPRCRDLDLKAGLEARVHDPLWLLARQWQVGEYAGRDAGSPVTVQVTATTAALDRYASGTEPGRALDNRLPLEALVEREAVRPAQAADDLRQAAEAGLHFCRLLDAAGLLARLKPAYLAQYPLAAPAAPAAGLDADARRFAAVVAGRVIDGVKLHADLSQAAAGTLPPLPALGADHDAVLPVATAWLDWYGSLFSEPAGADAWAPERMEYAFAVGTAGDSGAFTAREYDGGALDWHTFDRTSAPLAGGSAQRATTTRSVMATPVTFRGMPARRFWELEDASVDIASLTAGAEDLGRLLLREFALIYGNDWFQVPLAVPVGSEVSLDSLQVADTFGLTTTIPHYADADGAAGRWRMFSLSTDTPAAEAASARLLVVVSSAVGALDGAAIEDVLLLRDELADMAWGVEQTVVGPSGRPLDRALAWRTGVPPIPPPAAGPPPRYRLGSTVPDYWVPFLPVAVNDGPLQMRRGTLPAAASRPLGRLLGYPGLTMFLEELPREGVHLERRYRHARGLDGTPCVWLGRRRSTGRGEGRSGLRFDFLEV